MLHSSYRRLVTLLAFAAALLVALPLVAYAAAGDLDTTFNGTGMQTTNLGGTDAAETVVRLPGGKFLVAGNTGNDIALVKYTNGGIPDTSFGGGDGKVTFGALTHNEVWSGLAVLGNGKILVATDAQGTTGPYKLVLYRFTASGNVDTTFGGGTGKRILGFGMTFGVYDLGVLASGKFLVSGELYRASSDTVFMVARFKPSGALDKTFGGGDGVVKTNFSPGDDGAWRMAVDSKGRVVVGGWAEEGTTGHYDLGVARYTPDGVPDHTFSGDGKTRVQIYQNSDDYVGGIVLQGSKIVAGIYSSNSSNPIGLVRFTAAGTLDPSFGGGDGEVLTPSPDRLQLQDIARDSAGRMVAVAGDYTTNQFVVVRYLSSGNLDSSFGSNGFSASTSFGSSAFPLGVVIDSNNKIVTVGQSSSDFAVARFLSS